jgi:hypothetical protein
MRGTRDAPTPEAFKATVNQLVSQGHVRAVTLRPFTEGDLRNMLAALAHNHPPAALVRKFLIRQAAIPFSSQSCFAT